MTLDHVNHPLIIAENLRKTFARGGGFGRRPAVSHPAVDGVSLSIPAGTTLGCVGGSGSGKTTLGRMLVGLVPPDEGRIVFDGRSVVANGKTFDKDMQIVFQDPVLSLNPRRTIGQNICRPMANRGLAGTEADDRMAEMMRLCGLDPALARRYPNEISGGQCQRVAIARVLTLEPRFLFLDEPVSALDVSVQAQILNLLLDLQDRLGLTYFFVTHDLKLIRIMAQQVMVMLEGRVVEEGRPDDIWLHPRHTYTRTLIRSVLVPGRAPDWDAMPKLA